MRIFATALRSISRPTGARERRARRWFGVLLLAALTLGAAVPPAPRVCKLRGEIVLPAADAAASVPVVETAHDHGDRTDGTPIQGIVQSCSSLVVALPTATADMGLPDVPRAAAFADVLRLAPSHDPPPPFRPPRLS